MAITSLKNPEAPQIVDLSSQRRTAVPSSKDMVPVLMNEFSVTTADNRRKLIATYAVANCVAVAMHDPENNVAGLLHLTFGDEREVKKDIFKLLNAMWASGATTRNIRISLLSGQPDNLIDTAIIIAKGFGVKEIGVDRGSPAIMGYDIVIDAADGRIYNLLDVKDLIPTYNDPKMEKFELAQLIFRSLYRHPDGANFVDPGDVIEPKQSLPRLDI